MSLYEQLSEADPTLLAHIQKAIEQSIEMEQAQKIAAEHDPTKSRKDPNPGKSITYVVSYGSLFCSNIRPISTQLRRFM